MDQFNGGGSGVVIFEIEASCPLTIGGPEFHPPYEFEPFVGLLNIVFVRIAAQHPKYTTEQSAIGFVIEMGERENIWPIELISLRAVFLPGLPFQQIPAQHFQWLLSVTATPGKVDFVLLWIGDRPETRQ